MVYKGVDRITPRDGTGDNEGSNWRYKRKWNAAMNESANWKTLFFSLFSFSLIFAMEIIVFLLSVFLSRFLLSFPHSLARSCFIHTHVNAAFVNGASSDYTLFFCFVDTFAGILLDNCSIGSMSLQIGRLVGNADNICYGRRVEQNGMLVYLLARRDV